MMLDACDPVALGTGHPRPLRPSEAPVNATVEVGFKKARMLALGGTGSNRCLSGSL